MSAEAFEALMAKQPNQKSAAYKRDVRASGVQSLYVREVLVSFVKMLSWMDTSLAATAYLASDSYSLADIAVVPYVFRLELLKLARIWDKRPRVADWFERIEQRPSFQQVLGHMTDKDWAPFRNAESDPWPAVSKILGDL